MPVLPIIAIGATVAAAAVGAASAISSSRNQASASRYNAQVQANDAQVSAWNRQSQDQQFGREALMANEQGATEASRLQIRGQTLEAANISNAASSGLSLTGSTRDVILGSALNTQMDSLDAQYRGSLEAYQKRVQQSTASYNNVIDQQHHQDQEELFTQQAGFAGQTGMFNAAGAVLGAVGQSASDYARYG